MLEWIFDWIFGLFHLIGWLVLQSMIIWTALRVVAVVAIVILVIKLVNAHKPKKGDRQ